MADKVWFYCEICKGPIYYGEPVSSYNEGWAHRFKTWCDHYRTEIKKYDEKIAKEMGLDLDRNM